MIVKQASVMLVTQQHGSVLQLTLNRPSSRNALGGELVSALEDALNKAARDFTVGALVLNGAPPGFCSGSDLKELAELDSEGLARHEAKTAEVVRSLAKLEKPVFAAVAGFAIGGGCFLAASCDFVFTSGDAKWHLPEVALGWIPPWGFAALISRVGFAQARRLALLTSPIDGCAAEKLGLVDRIVGDSANPLAVTQAALEEATRLAASPRSAVAATKRFFRRLADNAEALDVLATRLFRENCSTVEAMNSLGKQSRPARIGNPHGGREHG